VKSILRIGQDQGTAGDSPGPWAIARKATLKLLEYCRANDWAGFDPYDALNSRIFKALPFRDLKIARLALTQAVKRCPINLRPMLLVPKTANPKGIALFLPSLLKLNKIGLVQENKTIDVLVEKLLTLRSAGHPYSCWGYNFDWQTRGDLVPKGTPNIICSTFAANALLDVYEQSRGSFLLDSAISTAEFVLEILFFRKNRTRACFCYTPLSRDEIHNANLLGAALLCRVSRVSGQRKFLEPALEAARYSVGKQHEDGSWDYGESPSQRWIDNFHTGYNLVALRRISEFGGTSEFDGSILRGFQFYRDYFFRKDGAPKYFHKATFPIDIHSVAQSIITLIEFKDLSEANFILASSVLKWAMANMWDPRGFFYFQKRPFYTVRIPYMRWSEAWMLLALATYLNEYPRPDEKTSYWPSLDR
jgi:hypothetical protein